MDKPSNRARIVLADDHAEFLALASQLIESELDFEVVKTFSNGQALVDEAATLDPDLLVLDISMPLLNGIEAAIQLRALDNDARIVFLTVHEDQDYLNTALATGALGYIVKNRLATDLVPGLREALAGRSFVSRSLVAQQGALRGPQSSGAK
jgi:DNA-binding NarL/FixJ family response regulator